MQFGKLLGICVIFVKWITMSKNRFVGSKRYFENSPLTGAVGPKPAGRAIYLAFKARDCLRFCVNYSRKVDYVNSKNNDLQG